MNNIFFKKIFFRKGFGLLELVLYVGMLSGLMVVSSNMFISLSKGQGQTGARSEVNSSIRFSTERIKQDIKSASTVSVLDSLDVPTTTGPKLSMSINSNTVVYDVVDGVLRRKEGLSDPVPVTPPTISVDDPVFTRIENTNLIFNTTSTTVQINMIFRYNSTNPDWAYSSELQTTIDALKDDSSFVGEYSFLTYALGVTKDGTAASSSTINCSPSGINCSSDCSCDYPQGSNYNVTLTATTPGSFIGWGGDCSSSGTNSSCVLSMSSAKNVSATFTAIAPVITTTDPITEIAQTSALGGGNISSDGGASVTSKGIVWGTSINPTTALSTKTNEGTGTGSFTSNITGLSTNTLYHVRAYATNSIGTSYGDDVTFTTLAVPPIISTTIVTNITQVSASSGGHTISDQGSAITAKGVVWSTSTNPTVDLLTKTINGTGTGAFPSSISSLTPSTTYYVRAYATSSGGTAYGNEFSFTTLAVVSPTITTTTASSITKVSALAGGNITSDGGEPANPSGLVWSTSSNPTTSSYLGITYDGWGTGGPWESSMTGLAANTLYHFRAYATNSAGTSYGSDLSFTTSADSTAPVVSTTDPVTDILETSVTSGGEVTSNGGEPITERGVCYSTTLNPTTPCVAEGGTAIGVFTKEITGLTPGTLYHVRAYATNSIGTSYGDDVTFTTLKVPTITTLVQGAIESTTVTLGANVTSLGVPASISARGICYATTPNPTPPSCAVASGLTTGNYSVEITGLTPGTLYYYRGYATNTTGTGYTSIEGTITTLDTPTVTTPTYTSLGDTTVTLGANVTSLGIPAAISARGVCYGITSSPTFCVAATGTTTGVFTKAITGLDPGTLYYFRGYATNTTGTAYSADDTFITTIIPTVTTPSSTSITDTTATLGANVTYLGIPQSISSRGVCYAITASPTTPCVAASGTTTGVYTVGVTGLSPGTTYYYRGYATNSTGTAYSADGSFTTIAVPTVTSPTHTSVGGTTATLGANVTSLGIPASISARGTCYGTTSSPTTNCVAASGTTTGVFTQSRTGLTAGTTYYYRGYATNSTGTAYSADGTFTTLIVPTLTSPTSASVLTTTATLGANVTSLGVPGTISARGVCYAITSNPTTPCAVASGTTTGVYTVGVTGLSPGTLYYYRGYATNTTGTAYSAGGTFTTTADTSGSSLVGTPTQYNSASTTSASVTMPTGVVAGDIMFAHILHYFASADKLSTIPSGWLPAGGTGRNINGAYNQALYYKVALTGETGPYVFGFSSASKVAIKISAYRGNFNTANPIDVFSNTKYVTSNTTYQAASLNITNANSTVLMFPSVYSTSVRTFLAPTTQSGGWTEDYDTGNTAPDFSAAGYRKLVTAAGATDVINSVGSVTGTTIKHAFAVALNSNVTATPTLTTTAISAIGTSTATGGGNISSQGGAAVTARGVVWSTSTSPTIALPTKTSDGTGTGSFTSSLTGLTASTTYYVRAYATNSGGTAYGNEVSFATTGAACGGTLYNTYCWYKQNTDSQTCGTYCTSIGKTCVNSTQTCAQDNAALAAAGVTCSTTDLNNGYNTTAPGYNTSNSCNPRTDTAWSCGAGAVTTSSCSTARTYWRMLCSCSS